MRHLLPLFAALGLTACAQVGDASHPGPQVAANRSAAICRLSNAQVLGAHTVCTYDCGGSPITSTVAAPATCSATAANP